MSLIYFGPPFSGPAFSVNPTHRLFAHADKCRWHLSPTFKCSRYFRRVLTAS